MTIHHPPGDANDDTHPISVMIKKNLLANPISSSQIPPASCKDWRGSNKQPSGPTNRSSPPSNPRLGWMSCSHFWFEKNGYVTFTFRVVDNLLFSACYVAISPTKNPFWRRILNLNHQFTAWKQWAFKIWTAKQVELYKFFNQPWGHFPAVNIRAMFWTLKIHAKSAMEEAPYPTRRDPYKRPFNYVYVYLSIYI